MRMIPRPLLVAVAVLAAHVGNAVAADEKVATPAPTIQTVFVTGKGYSSFADKVNKMHLSMQAQGWKLADLEIYTENGDMEGAFVTYVRE